MKKLNKKKLLVLLLIIGLAVLTGCQRNVDSNGVTLPEKVIYLDTPWKAMMNEGFISALLVWPLAQAINLVNSWTGSAILSVALVTLLFNVITLPFTIKSTVQMQKMQEINPKLQEIQAKYEGRTDDQSRMAQAQEMQQLYNKYNLNPLGSIVTPLLQFPILIAMYYAVQRADAVVSGTAFGMPLSTTPRAAAANISQGWPLVLIFALMIISQFMSTKISMWLAEKKRKSARNYKAYADKGNRQSSQQNVMTISLLAMVGVLGFGWPIAMSVYWLINSVINILKTVYVQKRYVE